MQWNMILQFYAIMQVMRIVAYLEDLETFAGGENRDDRIYFSSRHN